MGVGAVASAGGPEDLTPLLPAERARRARLPRVAGAAERLTIGWIKTRSAIAALLPMIGEEPTA